MAKDNVHGEAALAEAKGPSLEGEPQTLRNLFSNAVNQHAYNVAVVSLYQSKHFLAWPPSSDLGNRESGKLVWTYKQLSDKADQVAASLYTRGIRKGMRIAVFLHNGIEWALLFWACAKLGATFVPLDARAISKIDLVRYCLQVIKPQVLAVADEEMTHALCANLGPSLLDIQIKIVAEKYNDLPEGWNSLPDLLSTPNDFGSILIEMNSSPLDIERDVVLIVFTSGTSGLPKACPHTNRTLWAAIEGGKYLRPDSKASDRVLQHLPSSHIFACGDPLVFWSVGATIVYPSKFFEAGATLIAIENEQCTHMSAVPGLILAVLTHPSFSPQKTQSLQAITMGSTVISPEIYAAASHKSRLGAKYVLNGFGMSEGIPALGTVLSEDVKINAGCLSVGKPTPGTSIRICKPGTRQVLSKGEVGELHFGGDILIAEYLSGDCSVFYADDQGHWLATGDQARMDTDGAIYVLGRYKDIIIRGGENLSPALIEASLNKAGVMSQVVGVPDEIADEVPVAVIQSLRPGALPYEQMQQLVIKDMGSNCVPTAYLTLQELGMDAFPMTSSGKVRKVELKQLVIKHILASGKKHPTSGMDSGTISAEVKTTKLESMAQALTIILASLIGQNPDTVPQDRPLNDLLDSINILRLQSQIKQQLGKNISIIDLLHYPNINTIAQKLQVSQATGLKAPPRVARKGPPGLSNMVHTQGHLSEVQRTQQSTNIVLKKIGLEWEDVEDVFPMTDIQADNFEATRKMSSTVRICSMASTASVDKLQDALERSLSRWDMFRSIALKHDATPLFVVVKASKKWYDTIITKCLDLETPQDLLDFRSSDPEKTNVHAKTGQPLVHFILANVKSTGTAGIIMLVHHNTHDAISLAAFGEDIQQSLKGETLSQPRTPFKLFADMWHQYKTSVAAQIGATFHADRARGIGYLGNACWPRQRCQGWLIGDDAGYRPTTHSSNDLLPRRLQVDDDGGQAGFVGITQIIRMEHLVELKALHGISAPIVFKAACALLNSHLTGLPDVLFSNTQAGRQWPFMDDAVARYLPNPITLTGDTLFIVVNRINVDPQQNLIDFLTRLEAEQRLLTTHAHAPTKAILDKLGPSDVAVFKEAKRQLLNWGPNTMGSAALNPEAELHVTKVEGWTDVMLEWHCGMLDAQTGRLIAQWDGCQAGKVEVEDWIAGFVKALHWVASPGNWARDLGQMEW